MANYQVDYAGAQAHFLSDEIMFQNNSHYAIVIHKTGGDATPAAVYNNFLHCETLPHNDKNWGKSAHYAIGTDGKIWQFVPEAKGAGANGQPDGSAEPFWNQFRQANINLNECTLSIEHCDPSGNNDTPLTEAQKKASFQLVLHLAQKYTIPASHIKPHNSICATTCPGTYPMEELIQFVAGATETLQITHPFAAQYFTQVAEDRWHCPTTNVDIAYGILSFYRYINGAPRLPLTGEQHDAHLNVTYQVFEAGIIVYDSKNRLDHVTGFEPSYLLKLDSDLARTLLSHQGS